MLLQLIGGSVLKDGVRLMKGQDFFGASSHERTETIEKHYGKSYPESLKHYLATVSETDFMKDLKLFFDVMNGDAKAEDNALLDAIAEYVARRFCYELDTFDREFFFGDLKKRREELKKRFPGKSELDTVMRDHVLESTYQELTEQGQETLQLLKESPTLVVQTSIEISSEQRKAFREFFSAKYPYSFVEFQINPQILGGLKVFIAGDVADFSWLQQIQKISQAYKQFI